MKFTNNEEQKTKTKFLVVGKNDEHINSKLLENEVENNSYYKNISLILFDGGYHISENILHKLA